MTPRPDDIWDDEPADGTSTPSTEQPKVAAPEDDWSTTSTSGVDNVSDGPEADDSKDPAKVTSPRATQQAVAEPTGSDPRFLIFNKVVPLGIGTCDRWPGKKCVMVGHGAGWHVHVQDVLVEMLSRSLVPGIHDDHGRHVRFYRIREDGLVVRFDTPRATTIYLHVRENSVRKLNNEQYKLALRGKF
jgi:hypothetical protein